MTGVTKDIECILGQINQDYRGGSDSYSIVKNKDGKYVNIKILGMLCAKVVKSKNGCYLSIENRVWGKVAEDYPGAVFMKNQVRLTLPFDNQSTLKSLIKSLFDIALNVATPEFGCCSEYEKCSDAKWCVRNDLLKYKECYYFKNLREGRIFYGKNRNVD